MSSLYQSKKDFGKKLRQMVLFSMLGAILVIFKEINPIRYNVEFVSMMIIAYTCVFGLSALIPTYVYVGIEIVLYGLGFWNYSYLFIWLILVLVTFPFRHFKSPILFAMIAGIYGLMFGAFDAITMYFVGGMGFAIGYWLNGLVFDFAHCGGNFIITLFLVVPLRKLLEQGKEMLKL